MNNICLEKSKVWCQRLHSLMKEHGYTQETFLRAYKSKYGGGTQANVSRWLRVGTSTEKSDKDGKYKTIGFPSFENMVNIADFFGVTVGYLTGETDFKTFSMEKACNTLGITEDTGDAIKAVTSGSSVEPFGKYHSREYRAALRCLITADSFPSLVKGIQEHAQNIYYQKHPIDRIALAEKHIKRNILGLARQCQDYQVLHDDEYGDVDEFKNNNIEPTDELLAAIYLLNNAENQMYSEEILSQRAVKLSEYELQHLCFETIKKIVEDANQDEMAIPRPHEETSL